jgi:alkylated DNA repair dioxygenase AlkB
MQSSLFPSNEKLTLVDDPDGSHVVYFPERVPAENAHVWFSALRDSVKWSSERRMMYDRDVDVPRLMARFNVEDASLPACLNEALIVARSIAQCDFNSIGLNYYRDGNDSVALHNDKLHELIVGEPIVLISLGASRRMTIRSKLPQRRSLSISLESGSVLLMSYATQLHYDHGIPKMRTPIGARISLAFRRRPR